MQRNPILILGLGNTLFTDDGAGIYAVRMAESRWGGEGVDFKEGAAGGLELLDMLHGYKAALIVDAATTGQAEPGEVYIIALESLPALADGGAHGAHLGTALEVAQRMGIPMPERIEAIAIEAYATDLGEELSAPVAKGLQHLVDMVLHRARQWAAEVDQHA